MNGSLLAHYKKTLNEQGYFMNDDWLLDCVEYYANRTPNTTGTEVLSFVRSQWELSNLREINNKNGCLPKDLAQNKCTTLRGSYILQVEKAYDISTSKFKQLEQIRNVDQSNLDDEDTKENQSNLPRRKRMMQLHFTDGIQDIVGIEYSYVPGFNAPILPGFKMLIKGPLTCRRGVLLLTRDTIQGVGGEVAELLIPNAIENILARALNLPQNPDPYNDKRSGSKIPVNTPESPRSSSPIISNQQIASNRKTHETKSTVEVRDEYFEDDFDIDLEEITRIERNSQKEEGSSAQSQENSTKIEDPPVNRKDVIESQVNDNDLIVLDDDDFDDAVAGCSWQGENVRKEGPKKQTKVLDFVTKKEPPKICDFIHEILEEKKEAPDIRTIRARVKEHGKLSKMASQWMLDGVIYDETGNFHVAFSNEVLENLLGFTVEEYSKKRKQLKKNPELEEELRKKFRLAEWRLKNIDALFELKLSCDGKRWVTSFKEISEEQKSSVERSLQHYRQKKKI